VVLLVEATRFSRRYSRTRGALLRCHGRMQYGGLFDVARGPRGNVCCNMLPPCLRREC